ncbi:hypothetical protein PCANC_07110 [Puccinia coronata f. sp. avenae]|uniref:Uncharacterized protein n=1 Tax=Puccinia coronata f. sp. avenae TaxID=200324 RepID=A0A2N5VIQ9_9BASI|nr:hypothetical protein PCANC_22686 [Puccinia coronata f. sp. avenae]PLW49862.1 hypothetical protein PCANC_07110 [Puccinia coronata f. sp. avenae]
MSTTKGGPFQPGHHTRVTLSATQLKWLQETQNNIDLAISRYEGRVGDDLVARLHKIQSGDDRRTWDWFIISQHRQEMLASLPLNNTIKEIFANIKATSDTELTPPRALVRIPLLWRSAEITMFAQRVDNMFPAISQETATMLVIYLNFWKPSWFSSIQPIPSQWQIYFKEHEFSYSCYKTINQITTL